MGIAVGVVLFILAVVADPGGAAAFWAIILTLAIFFGAMLWMELDPNDHPTGSYSGSGLSSTHSRCGSGGSNDDGHTYVYDGCTETWSNSVVATCRDGRIFEGFNSGLGTSWIQGSYSDGYIYDSSGRNVGRYDSSGHVYRGTRDSYDAIVATCESGRIYLGKSSYGEQVGCYRGQVEAAAAGALLLLLPQYM